MPIRPAMSRAGIEPNAIEPLRVKREHGGDIGARRMPHDEQPSRVAAKFCDVVVGPAQSLGAIHQKIGEPDFRVEPIVRHDDDVSARGQRRRPKADTNPLRR